MSVGYKILEYPLFNEICSDIDKSELIEIIQNGLDPKIGIEQAVDDYIEANYEYTEVIDYDTAYENYRDSL